MKYTYEKLLTDSKKRAEFFAKYDRLIAMAREAGHYEEMAAHALNRKDMLEHFSMFD